ncbi:helix-turn-helix domain-containing protein [Arthrobacter sp. zg-Y20]|uniref:helix-turn-helix domain-containing protein n=1 Tax=unclassified Arthrobacter TaxID=235627 RepID=UPI001D1591D1|nr:MULTISPECIES: helix-turn-helix transcriptional regulator [unclassified Arthrobacter]MCC3276407.1 helix-turn-helix domain-containing protein [Arthrobacter sp. zg-Y20]MDK1316566.1 helix-turn-helix transcriptional regulator [Arthrobacter sp. zg.Y20]WIB06606.1 helix-turn-helix transcriptional regulator [Arthrobacter sp. zg-Y20]
MSNDPVLDAVPAVLRAQIAYRNASQSSLSRETGIPQSTISRILSGQRVVDLEQLVQICRALGVSVGAVMDQAERAAQTPDDYAPVIPLRRETSEDVSSIVGRAAARRGKGKKEDGLEDD